MNENIDMGTMEVVLSVIRLWFGIFLYDHLLRLRHDLEYNSLYMLTGFHICGCIASRGPGVPILWLSSW